MTRTKQLMRENNAFERALSPEFNQVLTEYLYVDRGVTRCEDSTDYRLEVRPGDTLSVVRRISDRALVKKDGVTGWYFGRME